jgi:hypothetical protein
MIHGRFALVVGEADDAQSAKFNAIAEGAGIFRPIDCAGVSCRAPRTFRALKSAVTPRRASEACSKL